MKPPPTRLREHAFALLEQGIRDGSFDRLESLRQVSINLREREGSNVLPVNQ